MEKNIKEIYHDLRNFCLLSDEEYISKILKEKIGHYEIFYPTNNEFLDIVVADKLQEAYNRGINIECDVDFTEGDFIDPLDICSIFGNILDNAIEAADAIEEEEKYIFFYINSRGNFINVILRNSIKRGVVLNEDFTTTKKNKGFHGYGTPNVRRALSKYNGECYLNRGEKEFHVSIIIPLKNGEKNEKYENNENDGTESNHSSSNNGNEGSEC